MAQSWNYSEDEPVGEEGYLVSGAVHLLMALASSSEMLAIIGRALRHWFSPRSV